MNVAIVLAFWDVIDDELNLSFMLGVCKFVSANWRRSLALKS